MAPGCPVRWIATAACALAPAAMLNVDGVTESWKSGGVVTTSVTVAWRTSVPAVPVIVMG